MMFVVYDSVCYKQEFTYELLICTYLAALVQLSIDDVLCLIC
jgi:hypothetical protein